MKGLRVDNLTTAVHTVKILAVDLRALSLDAVIDLMAEFSVCTGVSDRKSVV